MPLRRCLFLLLAAVLLAAALTALPASAQTPVEPPNGARIDKGEVILRWQLENGWYSSCLEWSHRPETSYAGGPFLAPDGHDCMIDPRDVAYLMTGLDVRRYYWHVQATQEGSDGMETVWGPVAFFDSVDPPEPPPPTGCTPAAAEYYGYGDLLDYANSHYPSWYSDSIKWARRGPICADLDGDRDREMIVWMQCCTGSSYSPWAIFKHNAKGEWHMAYVRIRDTVWKLGVRGRTVRAMMPSPYNGGCTNSVRYRVVSKKGARFRSRLTRRYRIKDPC